MMPDERLTIGRALRDLTEFYGSESMGQTTYSEHQLSIDVDAIVDVEIQVEISVENIVGEVDDAADYSILNAQRSR